MTSVLDEFQLKIKIAEVRRVRRTMSLSKKGPQVIPAERTFESAEREKERERRRGIDREK